PIDDPEQLHGRGPHVGGLANSHQCHESAIGAASNADLLRIHVAGGLQELCRVDDVLQVASAEVLKVGLLEGDAVPGGAAKIGRDDDIAAAGQRLRRAIKRIQRLTGGTSVRDHHTRVASVALQVEWYPQECTDHLAVEALVVHKLRGRHTLRVEAGDGGKCQLSRLIAYHVIHPEVGRLAGT